MNNGRAAIALMCCLTWLACSSEPPPPAPEPTPEPRRPAPPPDRGPALRAARAALHGAVKAPVPLEEGLARIDPAGLKEALTKLAADEMEGRRAGTAGMARARAWVEAELSGVVGLETLEGAWAISWDGEHGPGEGVKTYHNLIARYPGGDPSLRGEAIVVGAHLDHVGVSRRKRRRDRIYNGADDNASGSAALLAVARAMAEAGVTTRRDVLFVWFTAEEQGLHGAKAYCAAPPVPLEQTLAMVNLDMVGRNPRRPMALYGAPLGRLKAAVADARALAPEARVRLVGGLGEIEDRSDQQPFADAGVPVLVLHSGAHRDYHRVTDHADRIAWEALERRTRLTLALVVTLANRTALPP